MASRSLARAGPAQLPLWLLFAITASAQSTTTAANTQQTNTANTNTRTQTTATATNTQATARTTTLTDLPDINSSNSQTTTASTVDLSDAPSLSTTTGSNIFVLTGAPTIAGVGIPTQVIPYTAGAQFMQKSSLPQGTVFIIVGAILGFFGACVLLWRGMIAWSLHTSVKKAQSAALYGGVSGGDGKITKSRDKSGMYGMTAMGASSGSPDNSPPGKGRGVRGHGGGGRLAKASARGPSLSLATGAGRNSNLFFSPTAGAGSHVNGLTLPASRTSAYMPAGYYSSPSSTAPAGGAYSTQIGSTSTSSLAHLNPLGPARAGYMPTRTSNNSPPGSPSLHPQDSRHRYDASTPVSYNSRVPSQVSTPVYGYGHSPATSQSQLNLHAPGGTTHGGRAPSANLEDMFDGRR